MGQITLRLIGTAQDGGLPQFGCLCPNCVRARHDPTFRRTPASAVLRDAASGFTLLLDPSPELARQFDSLLAAEPAFATRPVFDAVAVTHVHWGHWIGLGLFGREVLGSLGTLVAGSTRVIDFLRQHQPTCLAFRLGHLIAHSMEHGAAIQLGPFELTGVPVPHRSEFADTTAFIVRHHGSRPVIWCPDIDRWPAPGQAPDLATLAATKHAVVLADATFGSRTELPGRDMSLIPHPTVDETLAYFAQAVHANATVALLHLNHSNPLSDTASLLAQHVRAAGFLVPRDGDCIEL